MCMVIFMIEYGTLAIPFNYLSLLSSHPQIIMR